MHGEIAKNNIKKFLSFFIKDRIPLKFLCKIRLCQYKLAKGSICLNNARLEGKREKKFLPFLAIRFAIPLQTAHPSYPTSVWNLLEEEGAS
jgi:hypothetical protein